MDRKENSLEEVKLLLVDEDEGLGEHSEMLESQADRLGMDVTTETASDSEEAVEQVRDGDQDAIVYGHPMAGFDGLQLLDEVNMGEESRQIPFVILTDERNEEVARKALNKGADGLYLRTPDGMEGAYEKVLETVAEEVEKRKPGREGYPEDIFNTLELGVFLLDEDLNFQYMNRTLEDSVDVETPEELNLKDFVEMGVVSEEAMDEILEVYEDSDVDESSEHWVEVEPAGGEDITVYYSIVGLPDGGYAGIAYDISEFSEEKKKVELLTSTVGHDIKNKLQGISGYAKLIDKENLDADDQQHLEKIVSSAEEAARTAEKASLIRRIGSGEREAVKLDEELKDVTGELRSHAAEEGIEIVYRDELDHWVWGGPLLKNLFYNIVENSIEHSEADTIEIEAGNGREEYVELSIHDDGDGMPYDTGQILENPESTGIFLISEIADEYDIEVDVESGEDGTEYNLGIPKSENRS